METRRESDTDRLTDTKSPFIIATTEEGTRAALTEARELSRQLSAVRTVLLVPRVGPWASLEGPAKDDTMVEEYRQMANQTGVDITVRLCVCGRYGEVSQWIPHGSMVVVGGKRRWWWPTREERIVEQLMRAGHLTMFADASRPHGA